jgi:prophage regulatory protein
VHAHCNTQEHVMSDMILARKLVLEIVPYSAAHLARLEKAGLFPRRVKLGACRVGWVEAEVNEWIADRIAKRGQQ